WAGRPEQQIWDGTLADILAQTTGKILSPCVIVVGEVVRLRAVQSICSLLDSVVSTNFVPQSPLSGKTVLVTRSANQSSQFSDRLKSEGAVVIDMPALEIVPPSSWDGLDSAIARLREFDWLVLTSANSVEFFFDRLATQIQDIRALAGIKIAVVGEKTAQKLRQRGLQPDFVPPEFVADSLAERFPGPLSGAKVLFPRVESGGRDVLVKNFTAKGAIVTEVAAYQSRCPDTMNPAALAALQNRRVDVITFASSKTVKFFCQLLERSQEDFSWQSWLDGVCIAAIGPQTSKACESLLGRFDVEAQEYTVEGLTQAIAQWLSREGSSIKP
ncbi:uroporphyrinogen-III synthase, partial [Leptolyngbya sp. FACHB-36]|uniref:uroporphyrinogen-III synthase n=1 Tax=Leptolyngbya sp. FACHB-36 TaxID=2692808 RepID=UPI00167FF577